LLAGTSNYCSVLDGPATSAGFTNPLGIAVNTAGVVFVSDYYRIRMISSGNLTVYFLARRLYSSNCLN
jgi:hypothetical protein